MNDDKIEELSKFLRETRDKLESLMKPCKGCGAKNGNYCYCFTTTKDEPETFKSCKHNFIGDDGMYTVCDKCKKDKPKNIPIGMGALTATTYGDNSHRIGKDEPEEKNYPGKIKHVNCLACEDIKMAINRGAVGTTMKHHDKCKEDKPVADVLHKETKVEVKVLGNKTIIVNGFDFNKRIKELEAIIERTKESSFDVPRARGKRIEKLEAGLREINKMVEYDSKRGYDIYKLINKLL